MTSIFFPRIHETDLRFYKSYGKKCFDKWSEIDQFGKNVTCFVLVFTCRFLFTHKQHTDSKRNRQELYVDILAQFSNERMDTLALTDKYSQLNLYLRVKWIRVKFKCINLTAWLYMQRRGTRGEAGGLARLHQTHRVRVLSVEERP
jgi:hypothetical protein